MNLEKARLPIARKLFQERDDRQSSVRTQAGDKTQAERSAGLVDSCSSPRLRPSQMQVSPVGSPMVGAGGVAPSAFHKVQSSSFSPSAFSPLPPSALPQVTRPFVSPIIPKRDSQSSVSAPSLRASDSGSPVPFKNGDYIVCEPFQNMKITERFLNTPQGQKAVSAASRYLAVMEKATSAEKFLQSIEFQASRSSQLRFNLSLGTGLAYMIALMQIERSEIFSMQQVNANHILFFSLLKTLVLDTSDKTIEELIDAELLNLSGLSRQKTDSFSAFEVEGLELSDRISTILESEKVSALEICFKNRDGHGNTLVALFGKEENYLYFPQNEVFPEGLFQYGSRKDLEEDLLEFLPELEGKFETISLTSFAKKKEESKKASS